MRTVAAPKTLRNGHHNCTQSAFEVKHRSHTEAASEVRTIRSPLQVESLDAGWTPIASDPKLPPKCICSLPPKCATELPHNRSSKLLPPKCASWLPQKHAVKLPARFKVYNVAAAEDCSKTASEGSVMLPP